MRDRRKSTRLPTNRGIHRRPVRRRHPRQTRILAPLLLPQTTSTNRTLVDAIQKPIINIAIILVIIARTLLVRSILHRQTLGEGTVRLLVELLVFVGNAFED